VDLEEEFQKVAEARLTRVERDLDRFRVRAVVAIRGVLDVAARVADPRRDDAGQAPHQSPVIAETFYELALQLSNHSDQRTS
jgi:hypothetical protein